jgi:hypothetical protein
MRVAIAVLVSMLLGGMAAAQATGPQHPELKRLEFMLGETTGKGKLYLPGGVPVSWDSTEKTAWTNGGVFLRTDTKINYTGFTSQENTFIFSWDPREKVYRLWAFTPLAAVPMDYTGNFEGNRLVLISKPYDNGLTGPLVYRLTFEQKEKELQMLAETKMGEMWTKAIEGTYVRRP